MRTARSLTVSHRKNHAGPPSPPGATTHAPQSNHACPPPRAITHACPPGATTHTPLEQPHMPPLAATMHTPRATTHAPPPEQQPRTPPSPPVDRQTPVKT